MACNLYCCSIVEGFPRAALAATQKYYDYFLSKLSYECKQGAEPDIFIWGGHWRGQFCNKGSCQWSVQDFQKETYSAFKRRTSLDCTALNVTSLCFAFVTSLV